MPLYPSSPANSVIFVWFRIYQVPIDVFKGITDEDAAKVVDGLAPKVADKAASMEQVKKLYELFCKSDCTMLEVSSYMHIFFSGHSIIFLDFVINIHFADQPHC